MTGRAPEAEPRSFIDLNKNFLNFPLARDARVKLRKVKDARTDKYRTPLPGEDRITLRFAKGAVRRCPTGFDLNVLFLLLAEIKKQGQAAITLPSLSAIVKQMRLGVDPANLRRVRASLELWSGLSIRFNEYYDGAGGNGPKRFPPPISELNIVRGGPISITIHEDWKWKARYFKRLPRPLPMRASDHNTVLYAGAYEGKPLKVRVRNYCRKIGINHNNRRLTLPHALKQAKQWYREHGVSLDYAIDGKFVILTISYSGPSPVEPEALQAKPLSANKPKPLDRIKLVRRKLERTEHAELFDDDEEQDLDDGLDPYGMPIYVR